MAERRRWQKVAVRAGVAVLILGGCNEYVVSVDLNGIHEMDFGPRTCDQASIVIPRQSTNPGYDSALQTKPNLGFDKDEPSTPNERGMIYQSCEEDIGPGVRVDNFILLVNRDYGGKLSMKLFDVPIVNRELSLVVEPEIIKLVYSLTDHKGDAQSIIAVTAVNQEKSDADTIVYDYVGFFVKKHHDWEFLWANELSCDDTHSEWAISRNKHTPQESIPICNDIFINSTDSPFSSESCNPEQIVSIELLATADMGCDDNIKEPFDYPPLSERFPGESSRERYFCGALGNDENGERAENCQGIIEPWPIEELQPKLEEVVREYLERNSN